MAKPWERFSETAPERAGREMGVPWRKYQKPKAKGEPTNWGRVALQLFWGANQQIENVLNIPASVAELAGAKVPRFKLETGESFEGKGEAKGGMERVARRIGTEIGASIPYMALPYMLPGRVAGGTAVQQAAGRLGEAVKAAPVRNLAGEVVAATGAGAGAGIAQQVSPGSVGAEIGGQVAGGLLSGAAFWTPASVAIRAGRALASRASPETGTRRATEFMARKYGTELSGARTQLDEAIRLEKAIPGFKPSLGEATGVQSFVTTQRRLESIMSGTDLDKIVQRRKDNISAIDEYARTKAPGEPLGPTYIVDDVSGKVTATTKELEIQVSQVDVLRRELTDVPRPKKDELGKEIRQSIIQKKSEARAYFDRRKEELGLKDADVTADAERFADEVTGAIEPLGLFQGPDVPESYRRVKALGLGEPEISDAPRTVTFDEMWQLRSQIERDIRTVGASRQANKDTILLGLHKMEEALDNSLTTIGEGTDLVENFKVFRQEYLRDMVQKFKQGEIHRVMRRTPEGDYLVRDENVASSFFAKNSITPIKQYVSIFGDDPAKMAAIETAAIDDFVDKAVVDGVIDQKKAGAWFKTHEDVLREMPARLENGLKDRQTANMLLIDRQNELNTRREQIESTMLGKEAAQFRVGKTPEEVLNRVMKNPMLLGQFLERASPEAVNGLKRYVWEYAEDNGERAVRPDVLKRILGEEHYNDLVDIFSAQQMIERVPAPTGAAIQPAVLAEVEKAIGIGLPQFASRTFAFQTGRASKAWLTTELLQRFLRGRSVAEQERIFMEALYNPQVANDLRNLVYAKGDAQTLGERSGAAIARRLNTRLFTLGIGTRTGENEPE